MTLRYKLGLTGTKLGCDRAECGACTVLIDDVPHYSCSMLTHTVRGKKIVTIEGLASADGTLHPVQQGVVEEQGFQCAFCMPGFVMAAAGYPQDQSEPDAAGTGARGVGQSVPLPGLRQDPHRADAAARNSCGGPNVADEQSWSDRTTPPPTSSRKSRARRSTPKTSAPKACCSPSCCSARCRTRAWCSIDTERGARDAGRQGHPDRRRPARRRGWRDLGEGVTASRRASGP